MNAWTVILAAGLGTYLLRISMVSSNRFRLPPRLDGAVVQVAPAAFAALAATSLAALALDAGIRHGSPLPALPIAAAVAAAGYVVARTGKPYLAVLAGMPTFWITTALMSF
jgi:branched-subunit amino acid transport protein